jgi:mRNA interferase MazF
MVCLARKTPPVPDSRPTYVRGDLWWANLNPVRGHEQAGRRPVLVVSDDRFNQSPLDMVFVVPLTRTIRRWPTRIRLDPSAGGVPFASDLMCDQLRAVSLERLERRIGAVDRELLERVENVLRLVLVL